MALFESYERRIDQINAALAKYDIKSIEEAKAICDEKGINVYDIVKSTQPICFENACWAYTVGAAMAIKNGDTKAEDAAKTIGVGLQSFCIPGSVADDRKVGLGHGNLGAMLLNENTQMGKPKKKHKKAKQLPLSKEEQIFQAARDLAAEIGISYSEALGFTLGIKDVTYGWEEDYTEEEFQALIDHAVGDTDYEHTLY